MNEQIKQIAERLRGLREALQLPVEDVANECDIPLEQYREAESGETDISVSMLQKIAHRYQISLDELMFDEEPKMTSYFLTRAGKGVSIERTKAYKYQSLASGFKGRVADPFLVVVEPNDNPICYNSHKGQEFNMVISGSMLLCINGNEVTLGEGDCIYFDSKQPHGMKALNREPVKFLAIIL
jgi:transcriptional regulator with XRE-family HTH domain